MAGMAAAGAITSIIGQNTARQAAKGAEEQKRLAQEDLIIENRKRATNDYLRQVRLEDLEQTQEQAAVNEKSMDIQRQSASTIGTATASAAERGVAGRSVDMIVDNFYAQENLEIGRLRINQSWKNAQRDEDKAVYAEQFEQRVSKEKSYVPKTQNPVDYFGPIFGAIGGTMGAANTAGVFKKAATATSKSNALSVPTPGRDPWGTY